ncbi:MAG: hypothetical protein ACMXYF_03710 [Candidatus Woesearchaeota archaeon]
MSKKASIAVHEFVIFLVVSAVAIALFVPFVANLMDMFGSTDPQLISLKNLASEIDDIRAVYRDYMDTSEPFKIIIPLALMPNYEIRAEKGRSFRGQEYHSRLCLYRHEGVNTADENPRRVDCRSLDSFMNITLETSPETLTWTNYNSLRTTVSVLEPYFLTIHREGSIYHVRISTESSELDRQEQQDQVGDVRTIISDQLKQVAEETFVAGFFTGRTSIRQILTELEPGHNQSIRSQINTLELDRIWRNSELFVGKSCIKITIDQIYEQMLPSGSTYNCQPVARSSDFQYHEMINGFNLTIQLGSRR